MGGEEEGGGHGISTCYQRAYRASLSTSRMRLPCRCLRLYLLVVSAVWSERSTCRDVCMHARIRPTVGMQARLSRKANSCLSHRRHMKKSMKLNEKHMMFVTLLSVDPSDLKGFLKDGCV